MKALELIAIITFIYLFVFVSDQEVETKQFFDKTNESFIDRVSPKFTDNGIEKPFYERALELVFKGPSRLFPKVPWLGYIIIYGGGYLLWLKWDIILSKIRRKVVFGKK